MSNESFLLLALIKLGGVLMNVESIHLGALEMSLEFKHACSKVNKLMTAPSGDAAAYNAARSPSGQEGESYMGVSGRRPIPERLGFILLSMGAADGPGSCYFIKTRKGSCVLKGHRPRAQNVCGCRGSWAGPPASTPTVSTNACDRPRISTSGPASLPLELASDCSSQSSPSR